MVVERTQTKVKESLNIEKREDRKEKSVRGNLESNYRIWNLLK